MLERRAAGDLYVCRALAEDSEVDDNIIGFHAQQTVEKALKVALVLADVELPYTHDLESLAELVRESATELPAEIQGTEWLTPWAADFRYDEAVALDRTAALAAAEHAHRWATSLLAQAA